MEFCGRTVTVTKLANDTGFSKSYVSLILAGKRTNLGMTNLLKLASTLNVDVNRLAAELQRRRANAAKKD